MKIYPVAAEMSKITFGIFFTTFSKCYHLLSRIPRYEFEILRCGNHQRFHEQCILSSDQVHACGQSHQAISSEHFLVNLNFRHPSSISCISVYTWQMRSSAAYQVHFCLGGESFVCMTPMPTKLSFVLRCSSQQKTCQHK